MEKTTHNDPSFFPCKSGCCHIENMHVIVLIDTKTGCSIRVWLLKIIISAIALTCSSVQKFLLRGVCKFYFYNYSFIRTNSTNDTVTLILLLNLTSTLGDTGLFPTLDIHQHFYFSHLHCRNSKISQSITPHSNDCQTFNPSCF